MARTPNDDRSDSKNPNNSAYWASESNHSRQTDHDDDACAGFTSRRPFFTGAPPAGMLNAARPERTSHIAVHASLAPAPPSVAGLYFVYQSEKGGYERKFNVDSASIEDAIQEAQAFWEQGGCVYLALYDQKKLYLDRAKDCVWPDEICQEVSSLGDLQNFVVEANKMQSAARRAIDKGFANAWRPDIHQPIKDFGAARAAYEALTQELVKRVAELGVRGVALTVEAIPDAARLAKQTLKAAACRTWIGDYQQGRIKNDPLSVAFAFRQKISAIKL